MNAGRELDALVAQTRGEAPVLVACVSTDAGMSACAWEDPDGPWKNEAALRAWLSEQQAKGWHTNYQIEHWERYKSYSTEIAEAWPLAEEMGVPVFPGSYFETEAIQKGLTLPHAICLAYLKAKGVEVEK